MPSTLDAGNAYLGHLYRVPSGKSWKICECIGTGMRLLDNNGNPVYTGTFRPLNGDKNIYVAHGTTIELLVLDGGKKTPAVDAEPGKLYYFGHRIIRIGEFAVEDAVISGKVPFTDMRTKERDWIDAEAKIIPCPGIENLPDSNLVEEPDYMKAMDKIMSEVLDE